jgi:catalase
MYILYTIYHILYTIYYIQKPTHTSGIACKGVFKVNKDLPGIPMHKLFSPATEYPIVFRFANTKGTDDAIGMSNLPV